MSVSDDNAKILDLLRPFAANWSGTLKRGDVVIPKDDLPNLVEQIVTVAKEIGGGGNEVTDADVFHVLREASRSASLQNQVATLRREFRIVRR